ncbi:MAG: ABC transporter permease [Hymenobacter sp.]|nr:MAG: ABC transporter permease [Hymenobacter sp.]
MLLTLRLTLESFAFAWQALRANLLRTALSLLGVTVGIFAIIAVLMVVDSLEVSVRQSMSFMGDKVIYVGKWPWVFDGNQPWWKFFNRPVPTVREFRQLEKMLSASSNKGVAIFVSKSGNTFKAGTNSVADCSLEGVSFDYRNVSSVPVELGRYFTVQEIDGARPVALIGATIAENLYPGIDPVGQDFKTRGRHFTVIGVLKKEGKNLLGAPSNDANCLIPFSTFASVFALSSTGMSGPSPQLGVKGTDTDPDLLNLEAEMQGAMRTIRGLKPREEDNFALNRPEMIAALITKLFVVIHIAGIFIGGLATLIGGFGIANIMFVSVSERTSIIGIQKALGAKNYFILAQFLFEAIFLCLLGGGAGILLVWLITLVPQDALTLFLSAANITKGLVLSVLIGIVAGIIPAVLAARLDPVIAIRAK